ncbi:MAG: insulinase family protein [Oscillospiraceae bacterium]|nr:insulinase family protein [Oscillospiraceae bacterium]
MPNITRRELCPFVFLTHLQTNKFKTATLRLSLLTQLSRDTAAKNALLPRVLLQGTANHPDMAVLAEATDELYGANIEAKIAKKGEIQCVSLAASFVDDACLPEGEGILTQITKLLGEILLRPALKDGKFQAAYVDGEREKLLDEIRGRINNKRTYALTRLAELMCDGEAFSVFRLGTEQEAETIDAETLTAHYRMLLASAPIEIFYSGTAPADKVADALAAALSGIPRTEPDFDLGTDVRMNSLEPQPRYFTEEMDVTQGKLSLGFRIGSAMEDPDYAALRLLHYLYGGSVNSKLFLHVRERLSLCYYASSVPELFKGLLLVASGIEFDKYDEALAEILAQLDAIRNGDITDEELNWAKKALITDLRMIADEQSQLEDFYLGQTILGEDGGPEELIADVERVGKKQIAEIAAGLQLDAVYFLQNAGADGNPPEEV